MQLKSIINWELHQAVLENKGKRKIEKEILWKDNKNETLRSKMKQLLAFDGEDEVFMVKEELKASAKAKPSELVELFQCTAVYLDVIKELKKDLGSALSRVGDDPMGAEREKRIEAGYYDLAELMVEVFGEDAAAMIIADTRNAINLEKIKNGKG